MLRKFTTAGEQRNTVRQRPMPKCIQTGRGLARGAFGRSTFITAAKTVWSGNTLITAKMHPDRGPVDWGPCHGTIGTMVNRPLSLVHGLPARELNLH